ncbi:MAG TPA: ABC transporter permease [Cyclobacteriaceae bacterium]|nr:ABC transporter permease [Cyclobacteriaceae bacterium]HMV10585.1 ABC transporter permease [Cyclobacteriaceae bacterium]HMV90685.1 ABC transporter permease [Cyclobacteriaceae bacterium]HMX02572.1 ABC transporter permease [Cyclobacteriaceae bacterium]HMX50929.1 ABC transporter permease [Cyclobacteriaceae bacterium]
MFSQRVLANLYIAIGAVLTNKIRSLLTALGIIFGVAAVIAMLAIGNGAQQEILAQIKLVGVNNIVIKPIIEQEEEKIAENTGAKKEKKKFSPGLTIRDVNSIRETIPGITKMSPEIILNTYVIRSGIRRSAKLVGIDPSYFDIFSFELQEGQRFNDEQLKIGAPVCVIGNSIKTKFFPTEDPIGKSIKVGPHWLKIVGVMKERLVSKTSISKLGIRDFNMDIYAPLQTVLVRYRNRDVISAEALRKEAMKSGGNFIIIGGGGDGDEQTEEEQMESKNYHQLDRLVIQVEQTEQLQPIAEIISRMLERRHYELVDYEIEIPELLLKQQQRTNDIFNYVLGAIAGISLLVGGIGIMNIMLASVLERIKEIGLRLSIGAKKTDIIQQFLFEAVMISVTGGIIGVILGISLAYLVSSVADIPTVISFMSIVLSFGVAATVGLIFGIAPARKAANQDPITSLRYE